MWHSKPDALTVLRKGSQPNCQTRIAQNESDSQHHRLRYTLTRHWSASRSPWCRGTSSFRRASRQSSLRPRRSCT